jgi:hypothetical protein
MTLPAHIEEELRRLGVVVTLPPPPPPPVQFKGYWYPSGDIPF